MIKPSIWLSVLTSMIAADLTTLTSNTSKSYGNATSQTSLMAIDEPTEEQQINDEAKRSVGRDLLQL